MVIFTEVLKRLWKVKPGRKEYSSLKGSVVFAHTFTPKPLQRCLKKLQEKQSHYRAQYLRVLTNELDRIQSHLLANSTYFKAMEHETLFMYMLGLREPIMDAIELLTGNRVNMGWNVVGGVKMDIKQIHMDSILEIMDKFESEYGRYVEMFESGPLVGLRSHDVGKMTRDEALMARAVGPVGRASGLKHDIREQHHTYRIIWTLKLFGERKEIILPVQ